MNPLQAITKAVSSGEAAIATTEAPGSPPVPVPPDSGIGYVAGGLGAAIITGLFAFVRFSRVFSNNKIEMTKDRVEGQLLETVMKERDAAVARADRLQGQGNLDASAIATLTEQNSYLRKELARVQAQFERVEKELETLRQMVSNIKPPSTTLPPTP